VSVNAESRALRDARRDIPKALQRGELATAADIYLKLGLVARQDFKSLPDELRAGVSTLFAKRAWSHLHGLAVRAEKHPPLVADDATWWFLLVATVQMNDRPRATKLWARLRPAAPGPMQAAIDAWLSPGTSRDDLTPMTALLPPDDPRLGQQAVAPRVSTRAPKTPGDVRPAVIEAFAVQPFHVAASVVQPWAQALSAEGRAALWETVVPLALRESLRRIKGVSAGSAADAMRVVVTGLDACDTAAMAPLRATLAPYVVASVRGDLSALPPAPGVHALHAVLRDPASRDGVLVGLDGADLSAIPDDEVPACCASLLALAPRGAVLCAVARRLTRLHARPALAAETREVLRLDEAGLVRAMPALSAGDRTTLFGLVAEAAPERLGSLAEAHWPRADEQERELLSAVVVGLIQRRHQRLRYEPGPELAPLVRASGTSEATVREILQNLYAELELALDDDLPSDELGELIEEFAPFPRGRALNAAWLALAMRAEADYLAARLRPDASTTDPALRTWTERGALYHPALLHAAMQTRRGDEALTLARDFAKRRKGLAPWMEAARACDGAGLKSVADAVLGEGLARFSGDFGALCAAYESDIWGHLTLRHRRRVAEAVVAVEATLGGRALTRAEATVLRWSRATVTRAKAAAAKRQVAAAKKQVKKAVKR
jgi:hypothetical protein